MPTVPKGRFPPAAQPEARFRSVVRSWQRGAIECEASLSGRGVPSVLWTIGCRLAPTVEAMVGINSLHVRPTANRFLSAPPDSKNDPKPGEIRNSGCSLFPPCFFSVICSCRNHLSP